MVVPTFCATSSTLTFSTNTYRTYIPYPPLSSSSPLAACPHYLPVQKPIQIYLKLSITASKTFSRTEPSIPLSWVDENACGGEIGSVRLQSSSPKHKARHSVVKKKKLYSDRAAEQASEKKTQKQIHTFLYI
jgi:hypothetical protein